MRRLQLLLALLACSLLGAVCARSPPPVEVVQSAAAVGYLEEVQPILDRRCAVCHACYNAPCQLKLSSYEGVERGGSKARV